MDCPLKIDDWKMFEKNNLIIRLNIVYTNEKEITVQLIYQKLIRIVKNK